MVRALRIAYLCMESVFSVRPLEALLQAGHDVRFVMRPIGPLSSRGDVVLKRHRGFDLAMRRLLGLGNATAENNPLAMAADRDIPAWLVGNVNTSLVHRLLRRERIELIVIAFFNQLLTPTTYGLADLGAINLHPSALPQYRGPAPLFWTFRDAVPSTALTIHRIAAGEDNGNILEHCPVEIPLGLAGEDLVDQLADQAHAFTPIAVEKVANGVPGTPQDEALATRAPRPGPGDVVVDASFGATRLFHFVRGVGRWNNVTIEVGGERVRLLDGVDLDVDRRLPGESAIVGDDVLVGCPDGVVRLRMRRGL